MNTTSPSNGALTPAAITRFLSHRLGCFIHTGCWAPLGRDPWVVNQEGIDFDTYRQMADHWRVHPEAASILAQTIRRAGARYAVIVTKHHDGFPLWASKQQPWNAANCGPKRDLVQEFVTALRQEGLAVGIYHSLADWSDPDFLAGATDAHARERFLTRVRGYLAELCTGYGKIDYFWHDGDFVWDKAAWRGDELNAFIRSLQPEILINNRAGGGGDYGTPEGHVTPDPGRIWEACLTMPDYWGSCSPHPDDWLTVRSIIRHLRTCVDGGGNLLLDLPTTPDALPLPEAAARLERLGAWCQAHSELLYGAFDATGGKLPPITNTGTWTTRGNIAWFWLTRVWPGPELALGGFEGKITRAVMVHNNLELGWRTEGLRTILTGLPETNPEPAAGIPVIRLECATPPKQFWPYGSWANGAAQPT